MTTTGVERRARPEESAGAGGVDSAFGEML